MEYAQQVLDVVEFEPGITTERVIDAVLAGQRVGRGPVRDTMHRLAEEGWLTRTAGAGARIHWART